MSNQQIRGTNAGVPAVALFGYGAAVLAWIALITGVMPMPGAAGRSTNGASHSHTTEPLPDEVAHMSEPGVPEALAVASGTDGVLLYLLMWGAMILAMMYPSSARIFQTYADALSDRSAGQRLLGVGTVIGVYTLAWIALGLVPLVITTVVPIDALSATYGPVFLGPVLLFLAAYQLSPYKYRCLYHCRTPSKLLPVSLVGDLESAVRFSRHVSRDDVGTCWVWMGLMVAVGSMNLPWMAAITFLLSMEQMAPKGEKVAKALGVLAVVVAVGLLARGAL